MDSRNNNKPKRERSHSEGPPPPLKRGDGEGDMANVLKSPFNYENIHKHVNKTINGYRIQRFNNFLELFVNEGAPNIAPSSIDAIGMRAALQSKVTSRNLGWKLHISVNKDDVKKAWEMIEPILISNKITGIKIPQPKFLHEKTGSQITIYQFLNKSVLNETWEKIIKEIEEKLIEAKIEPGVSPADRMVEGCQYCSRRNDINPDNKDYLSEDAAIYRAKTNEGTSAYNFTDTADPFESLRPFEVKEKLSPRS